MGSGDRRVPMVKLIISDHLCLLVFCIDVRFAFMDEIIKISRRGFTFQSLVRERARDLPHEKTKIWVRLTLVKPIGGYTKAYCKWFQTCYIG